MQGVWGVARIAEKDRPYFPNFGFFSRPSNRVLHLQFGVRRYGQKLEIPRICLIVGFLPRLSAAHGGIVQRHLGPYFCVPKQADDMSNRPAKGSKS